MWDTQIVPLLRSAPALMAVTLLRKLQDDYTDRFPDGMLRTLQRRIRQWRAVQGPSKEMFFPQGHAPGHRGLSDFTAMGKLGVTIANAPFAHILYHFVLNFSRWEHVEARIAHRQIEALLVLAVPALQGIPRLGHRDSSPCNQDLTSSSKFERNWCSPAC
ncbi:hypothetical protein [Variovorax sp. EBFNA2]|uniref:hypothetical protein n=1 Tax=Variovorax sp. EBFNA2 TaxID=3342097 RepID=UPI0035A01A38